MIFSTIRILLAVVIFFSLTILSHGQAPITISGKVTDSSKDPLVGVNIRVKDKVIGTISNADGVYELTTKSELPFTLIFSSVGFGTQEKEINSGISRLDITMEEEVFLGQEVVVSASRYTENILESPVTIEKLDLIDIQQTPAANFYDGLNKIKGVDMNNMSFTFKTVNTRGFTGNTNYRFNQIIDGIDNAPPGLNFAAGNIFGISKLDIESVELLVGASSALYGPGGMNGTLLMRSKSPFEYQGLSMSAQTGLMHVDADYRSDPDLMYDFALRYAKAINDRLAFKVNFTYVQALDWHANDRRNRADLDGPPTDSYINPAYDGVNVYGDENVAGVDLGEQARVAAEGLAENEGLTPGTPEFDARVSEVAALFPESQIITRTGYDEEDLVDYDTKNFVANAAVHYLINEDVEFILQGAYGNGTAVYTAQNRFSLQSFEALTGKAELKGNNFFLRAYFSKEDAGETYDAGSTALQMNEAWRPSAIMDNSGEVTGGWFSDYFQGFITARLLGNSLENSYRFARNVADNRDQDGNILNPSRGFFRPLPGEPEFEQLFDEVTGTPLPNGTLVVDKSSFIQFDGMYNFSKFIPGWEALAGYSARFYRLDTDGTTYFDTPGNPIKFSQVGAYAQLSRWFLANRVKFTASGRYDKNENFDDRITPRGSFVVSLDKKNQRNLRGSVQTAFRFPAIADQWVDLDVGILQVFGGLPQLREQFNFGENPAFPSNNPNPVIAEADRSQGPFTFPEFKPERATAYELGYRGLHLDSRMLVDAYGYITTYNGFLASQVLVREAFNGMDTVTQRFSTTVSTDAPLTAYGWALGADYLFDKGYTASASVSHNDLEDLDDRGPGFQSRFNTPKYRFNVSLANRNVYNNVGFAVNYRWQDTFLWETNFGVGRVDSFGSLDLQVNYKFEKLKSVVKVGGSNILNDYYITGIGNPSIGAIYYVSVTFDEMMN